MEHLDTPDIKFLGCWMFQMLDVLLPIYLFFSLSNKTLFICFSHSVQFKTAVELVIAVKCLISLPAE